MTDQREAAPTRYVPVEEWRSRNRLGRNPTYDALRRGDIPHVRIGRKILIPENALDLMLVVNTRAKAGIDNATE